MPHTTPGRPRRALHTLFFPLLLAVVATAHHVTASGSEVSPAPRHANGDNWTATLRVSPAGYLDVFYDGDAAAVNKTRVYNVRYKDGFVWVGYGSSAEPNADHKTVAMRVSDGAVGAFDNDGDFYVPSDSADAPTAGWFTTATENGIVYASLDGMAHVMGDTRSGSAFKYANVVPGASADASVTIIGNGGHARRAFSLGRTILHQVENDQGGLNFRVSDDVGRMWRDPASTIVTAAGVYTRTTMFELDGRIHVFEEWRPGDTGMEAAEKAILRFEPGQPEEFVALFDDHSDLAPWSHYDLVYTHSGDTYSQRVYPGVVNVIEADGQVYLALQSGRCGRTSDLSKALTEIANPATTNDPYGNPTRSIWYFGYEDRLYAFVADDGEVFLYDAAADAWSLDRTVTLGFTPHRFHFDPASRIMALASADPTVGYVAAFEVF